MPRFNCQHAATLHLILTNANAREASIAALDVHSCASTGTTGSTSTSRAGTTDDRDALTTYTRIACAPPARGGEEALARGVGEVGRLLHLRNRFYDYRDLGERRRLRVRHELGLSLDQPPGPARPTTCRTSSGPPTTRPRCRTSGATCSARRCTEWTGPRAVDRPIPPTALHHYGDHAAGGALRRQAAPGSDGVLVALQVHGSRRRGARRVVQRPHDDRGAHAGRQGTRPRVRGLAPGPGGRGRLGRPDPRAGATGRSSVRPAASAT